MDELFFEWDANKNITNQKNIISLSKKPRRSFMMKTRC